MPDPITLIGGCRGHALSIGTLCILAATATDSDERAATIEELTGLRDRYLTAVAEVLDRDPPLLGQDDVPEEKEAVREFARRISTLPKDRATTDRFVAAGISLDARTKVMPAIYRIIAALQEAEVEAAAGRLTKMTEKAALVDGMMLEMSRIGRMIGLISINASVEAARAGGESGRAFRVIAEEVQTLARQSADLTHRTRQSLAENQQNAVYEAARGIG